MPSPTATVYGATKERDPNDYLKLKQRQESAARAAQKEFGGMGQGIVTATPIPTEADTTYQEGEVKRRKQAAESQAGLAKAQDTRSATIADKVRAALYDRTQLQTDANEKIRQQDLDSEMKTKEQTQDYQNKLSQINQSAYKNAADRIDAMSSMYDKGMLEYELAGLAQNNQLSLSDIERYFSLLKNDITNEIKDMEATAKLEVDSFMQNLQTKSNAFSSIFSGLTKGTSAYITAPKSATTGG